MACRFRCAIACVETAGHDCCSQPRAVQGEKHSILHFDGSILLHHFNLEVELKTSFFQISGGWFFGVLHMTSYYHVSSKGLYLYIIQNDPNEVLVKFRD